MNETIVALSTPPLKSALALIRLSGSDCFFIVQKFFDRKIEFEGTSSIIYGNIIDDREIIDNVLVFAYKGPHSFTGENSIEISCHGNPIIYNRIISIAIKNGARMAERGEYSLRAYLNNKLDLVQAESINDLINAETEESKRISLMSLSGETSKLIYPLKKQIGDLLSLIEANFDYSEYTDIEEIDSEKIVEFYKEIIKNIEILIENGKHGKIIKEGINVAIVGKPNVGKSSLLNALIGEDKAIVTDIKGTTRDVVEGKINFHGIVLNLFDTAGIRDSEDKIEQIGIQKSKAAIEKADLILAMFDSTSYDDEDLKILSMLKDKKYIKVINKKDLLKDEEKDDSAIYISAKLNDIEALKTKIFGVLGLSEDNFKNPSLANERQLAKLEQCKNELNITIEKAKQNITIDILSEHIRKAYLCVLEILGEENDFDMAKEIFSRFCLGK